MANIHCPNCGEYFTILPDVCPYCCAQLGAPKNPNAAREMLVQQRAMLEQQRTELTRRISAIDVLLGAPEPVPAGVSLGYDAFRQPGGDFGQ